jgi:hypothetical protein
MKKLMSSICAMAMLATAGFVAPAAAQSIPVPQSLNVERMAPVEVQRWRDGSWENRRYRGERRGDWRGGDLRRGGGERYSYYRGHRGYRDYRPGYRRHNGFWFPAAAFITGAIIGGAIAGDSGVRVRNYGSAHVNWCSDRYRSYRASDNTFQPYNGPRRSCVSPYS